MSAPLVSVVIPAYNAERYIDGALESVFQQTYRHVEIIVVDDGSRDATRSKVHAYANRVWYLEQANAGVGSARNRGLEVALGDYIAFLDQDDLWRPEKLEVQLEVAARNPESGLVACDGVRFENGSRVSGHLLSRWVRDRLAGAESREVTGRFYREALTRNPITSPSQMLIPRNVVKNVGPMITGPHESEDWDYTLRIALRYPITMHQHELVVYRLHGDSRSGSRSARQFLYADWDLRVFARNEASCPPQDRVFVRRARRQAIRDYASDAYYHGRRQDPSTARWFLWGLLRRAPTEPIVALTLVATWLPDRLVTWTMKTIRGAGAVLHRIGRRLREEHE
jgi:glycosyltransferase involved in cell wall biosynthesis